MKISHLSQSFERKNSEVCVVTEYPPMDNDLDFAIITISGRYPEVKKAMNTKCKEIVYIHSGGGYVNVNNIEYQLNAGDVVLIESGETFYWGGNMTLHISCTPAFEVEQHVIVD